MEGGGVGAIVQLCFCVDRCNASIIPLQWELHSACSRCSSRYCTAGLFNTAGGTRNKLARCRSRNCPTPLSHAYLVKPLRLLPGPCKGLGIRSISSDPHKHRICTNTSKWRPTNSFHPDSVMVSALKLASERCNSLSLKPLSHLNLKESAYKIIHR